MRSNYALWNAENSDEGLKRRTLLQIIWKRKWWLVVFTVAFAGLGVAYVQYGTPIYQGSARVLLQQVQPAGTVHVKVLHGVEFVDTQAEVLKSPAVVRDAVASLGMPNLDPTNVEGLLLIMDSLKVARVPQTDIVSVAFRNEDPRVALAVVEALIKQYGEYLVQQQKLTEDVAQPRRDMLVIGEELWKAQAEEKTLAEHFGPKHPEMRAAQGRVAHWENLLRERTPFAESVEHQTGMNDDLLAKLGGVKIAILDGPALDEGPVWPNPLIVLPVAVVLGLLTGVGMVILVDRGDDSVRSVRDFESLFGVRACGQIPKSNGSGVHNIHRYAIEAPNSALAKAAAVLGEDLCDSGDSKQGPVVQVTSAQEQSGKTAVLSNLAFSLAQLGKKVCVVDADVRGGILHRVFGVSDGKGLSSLVRDETIPLGELLQTSPLAAVDVLTKGPAVRHPLHLLAQPHIEKALDALRWHYDIVLLDTPPLLSVSDASLLAPLADTVLVVLQARVSSAASVRRAIDMLGSVGAKNIGLVLNGSPIEPWMVDGEAKHSESRPPEFDRAASQVAPFVFAK